MVIIIQNADLPLKCMYTNTISIQIKLNELEALLTPHEVDVCSISETWLQSTNTGIPGYVAYRKDRPDSNRGGGVCIFVQSTLSSHEITIPGIHSNSEKVWYSINLGIETHLLVYLPVLLPSSDTECLDINRYLIHITSLPHSGILICGDFNYPGPTPVPPSPNIPPFKLLTLQIPSVNVGLFNG